MSAKTLQDGYQRKITNLTNELKRLTQLSDEMAEKRAAAINAQDQIHTAEKHVAYLQSERSALMADYHLAAFEQDEQALQEVVSKKDSIDVKLADLDGEIEELRSTVNANRIDPYASTALAIELDTLEVPDVFKYIKELEKILRAEAEKLGEKKKLARGQLITDPDIYADQMHELNGAHPSSVQRKAAIEKRKAQQAEDAKRYNRMAGIVAG